MTYDRLTHKAGDKACLAITIITATLLILVEFPENQNGEVAVVLATLLLGYWLLQFLCKVAEKLASASDQHVHERRALFYLLVGLWTVVGQFELAGWLGLGTPAEEHTLAAALLGIAYCLGKILHHGIYMLQESRGKRRLRRQQEAATRSCIAITG